MEDSDETLLQKTVQDIKTYQINALRRTIMTDLRCVGIPDTYLPEKSKGRRGPPGVYIAHNMGRLHNEFLRHRLSMLPVKLTPQDLLDSQYKFCLLVKQDDLSSGQPHNVTSKHITVEKWDEEKSEWRKETKKKNIFPCEHDDGILITRLYHEDMDSRGGGGEQVHLELEMYPTISTAKDYAGFSPVCLCTYMHAIDDKKVTQSNSFKDATKKEQEQFLVHGKYRDMACRKKNTFDLSIETVGTYTAQEILRQGYETLRTNLQFLRHYLTPGNIEVNIRRRLRPMGGAASAAPAAAPNGMHCWIKIRESSLRRRSDDVTISPDFIDDKDESLNDTDRHKKFVKEMGEKNLTVSVGNLIFMPRAPYGREFFRTTHASGGSLTVQNIPAAAVISGHAAGGSPTCDAPADDVVLRISKQPEQHGYVWLRGIITAVDHERTNIELLNKDAVCALGKKSIEEIIIQKVDKPPAEDKPERPSDVIGRDDIEVRRHYYIANPERKSNCHTLQIKLEDHTLGNLLQGSMYDAIDEPLEDEADTSSRILAVGYRKPYPLETHIEFMIRYNCDVTTEKALRDIRCCIDKMDKAESFLNRGLTAAEEALEEEEEAAKKAKAAAAQKASEDEDDEE